MYRIQASAASIVALALSISVTTAYAGTIRLDASADNACPVLEMLNSNSGTSTGTENKSNAAIELETMDFRPAVVSVFESAVLLDLPQAEQTSEVVSTGVTTTGAATSSAGLHPFSIMLAAASMAVVPEPSSVVLMGLGAMGLLYAAWGRRRRSA